MLDFHRYQSVEPTRLVSVSTLTFTNACNLDIPLLGIPSATKLLDDPANIASNSNHRPTIAIAQMQVACKDI